MSKSFQAGWPTWQNNATQWVDILRSWRFFKHLEFKLRGKKKWTHLIKNYENPIYILRHEMVAFSNIMNLYDRSF